jgi:hypothetical protein
MTSCHLRAMTACLLCFLIACLCFHDGLCWDSVTAFLPRFRHGLSSRLLHMRPVFHASMASCLLWFHESLSCLLPLRPVFQFFHDGMSFHVSMPTYLLCSHDGFSSMLPWRLVTYFRHRCKILSETFYVLVIPQINFEIYLICKQNSTSRSTARTLICKQKSENFKFFLLLRI